MKDTTSQYSTPCNAKSCSFFLCNPVIHKQQSPFHHFQHSILKMLLIGITVIFKYFLQDSFVSSPAILHPPVLCTSKQEPREGGLKNTMC